MIGTVFTAVFAIIMLFLILVNVLKGLTKGLMHTLVRITFIFISGILAIVIAVPLGKLISGALVERLNVLIESSLPGYEEIISASPVIGELMVGIPSVIISIVLYMVLFLLLLAIMAIPSHFIKKVITDSFPEIPKLGWAGALCGVIAGLAMFVFLSAPVVGMLTMVGDTASVVVSVASDGNDKTSEESIDVNESDNSVDVYEDIISPITDNFLVKFTSNIGGKAIFNSLTAFEVGGEKVSLSKEISAIADVFSSLMPVIDGGAPSEWTNEQINAIKTATEKISDSRLVSCVLAEILSNASQKWENGEAFLGMKVPTVGRPSIDNFLNELFVSFRATTSDTVSEDFGTLADILAQLHKYGMLSSLGGEGSDMTDSISTDGFISGLLETVMKNERFRGTAAAVINLGVYETLDILDVPATDSEAYDRFVKDITDSVNAANENEESLGQTKESVYKIFADHSIVVDKKITDYVAQYLMEDFGGRTDVTAEEVEAFFAIAFDIAQQESTDGLSASSDMIGASLLANGEAMYSGAQALKEILIELKNSSDESIDWNILATLSDRDIFQSDALTAESLKVTKEKIDSLSDEEIVGECENIENIIKNMVGFVNSVSGDDMLENADVSALGSALNSLGDSKILGDVSDDIIGSALKSDMVQSNISISDGTINSMLGSDDTDYENILVSVQNTASIINGLGSSEEGLTDEQVDEKLEFLLGDMTENTAEIIGDIFDTENVEKLGIPEEKADKIADSVNVFFTKMAESDADVSDSEDKDVKATRTVFKFISAIKTSEGNLFEETELTVEETVHIFMDSEISRETLVAASYSDGKLSIDSFGVAEKITKENKTDALNILKAEAVENYSSAEDKEEYKKAVCAVGAILGVDISSSFDSWVK